MKIPITILLWLFACLSAAQSPNILLVIADDMGLDPVPGYMPGPEKAAMPRLEALMEQGLTFDNVWADPLCSPTRSTIITGRYGLYTGVLNPGDQSLLPADEVTLHQYLNDIGSGYASCIIGKWHLGGLQPDPAYPNVMGIPHYAGLLSGAVNNYDQWPLTINGTTAPSTTYITTAITDLAIDWIGQQSAPWFCWVAYNAPHSPLHLPPLEMHAHGALPTDQASIDADPLPYYLAMCESVDHELGRLLDGLAPDDLENTVVIFIGDNGTDGAVIQGPYVPAHAKGSLYEGGVRVPMVIAGTGVQRAGEREPALVNTTDLFATIVETAGEPLSTYFDSRSLVPMFTQSGVEVRSCLYTEVDQGLSGSAIRDERWKLITYASGAERFYDLETDPWESTDLLPGGLSPEQQAAFGTLISACELSTSMGVSEVPPSVGVLFDPVTRKLTVQGNNGEPVVVEVFDVLGARSAAVTTRNEVGLASLACGVYTLRITQDDRRSVHRVLIE
jgi:arylsulfatase A-like enzyme